MESERDVWLWAAARALSRTQLARLAEALGAPADSRAALEEAAAHLDLPAARCAALAQAWAAVQRHPERERAAQLGLRALLVPRDLPPAARPIAADLPPLLFARGDASCIGRRGVAVVGARKASRYGERTARDIATAVARAGAAVVSGAAYGIDAAAHLGAMDAGGPTIAVLGAGLLRPYPPRHAELLERIAGAGLLLSEFPPDAEPLGRHFVIRNRTIAALARDVVVVEGAASSGARHTADYARELGRKLWAVPGEVGRSLSELPLMLLAEGARIVTRPEDIALGTAFVRPADRPKSANGSAAEAPVPDGKETENAPLALRAAPGDLDAGELGAHIVSLLRRGALELDELTARAGSAAAAVGAALTLLELNGTVERGRDGRWRTLR